MAWSTLNPRKALGAMTVAAAVTVLTAAPVSAHAAISGPAASARSADPGRSGPAPCQNADLRINVPSSITGDPAGGMGKRVWNLVFRDTADIACSLRGWPHLVVRTPAGKTVATAISDVKFSNLGLQS